MQAIGLRQHERLVCRASGHYSGFAGACVVADAHPDARYVAGHDRVEAANKAGLIEEQLAQFNVPFFAPLFRSD
jgi:hypothetical protein